MLQPLAHLVLAVIIVLAAALVFFVLAQLMIVMSLKIANKSCRDTIKTSFEKNNFSYLDLGQEHLEEYLEDT